MKVQFNLGGAMLAVAMFPLLAASAGVASAQANFIVDSIYSDSGSRVKPVPSSTKAPVLWRAPFAILHDNGPLITGIGTGFNGADISQLAPSSAVFGFGVSGNANLSLSDDFTVTGGAWQVDAITTFAYQTGSTTTSTFLTQNLQIWDGRPDLPGSSVVWGDLTTNVLASSTWSGIYRVLIGQDTNNQRPVMANVVNVGTVLPPGTYWLEWRATGSLGSGPFAPQVTTGAPTTGNAGQLVTPTWTFPVLDAGMSVEFPFLIDGIAMGGFSCSDLTQVVGVWGLSAGRCGNFNSNATVARYESAIYDFEPAILRGTAPGEYAYEVEFVANRPRQPSAAASVLVSGSPLPLQTATQNWNRAIAFNISHNGKYSIFRYNGSGLPATLQKWVTPVGVAINQAPLSNTLRVERVPGVRAAGAGTNGVVSYNLVFSINGVVVRTLPDTLGVDQFGTAFVRSIATTGNLVTDDWMEVLNAEVGPPQQRSAAQLQNLVSAEQQRANDAANALLGNDHPQFAPDSGKR